MIETLPPASLTADPGWSATVIEWLAGLFLTAPTAQVAASYRDGLGAILLDAIAEEPGCELGVARMRRAIATGGSAESVAARLGKAFAQLFDGVGGPQTASPYESAHVDAHGRLFQEPSAMMVRLLAQNCLALDPGCYEPADHLSIELALLGRLIRDGARVRIEAALLDKHLLFWVPLFALRCRAADETGFYDGAVSVLGCLLVARRAQLGVPLRRKRMAHASISKAIGYLPSQRASG